jgi:hypothetical protein
LIYNFHRKYLLTDEEEFLLPTAHSYQGEPMNLLKAAAALVSLCIAIAAAAGDWPQWQNRSVGKGSLTYADGNLHLVSEDNKVALAEANPSAYIEKGRFEISDQGWPSWAHPVACDGRLYIRNQGVLASYNVKAKWL